jgi:anoctamin-10
MAFYWKWSMIPAVFGIVLQLYDVLQKTPDNCTAIPFCIVAAVSAIMMPHFWRREEAKHALEWGTLDVQPELEPPRPQHWGALRLNPVSGAIEPSFSREERRPRYLLSISIITLCCALLALVILGTIYARHQLHGEVYGGIVTFQVILAALMETTNVLLQMVAEWLTDRENHRSQTDHEIHLLGKIIGLKFVNSFFVLYYIAFFRNHSWLFGASLSCLRNDCFLDLQAQLAIIIVFRLTAMNIIQYSWPRVLEWYRRQDRADSCSRACNKTCEALPCARQHGKIELADLSSAEIECTKEPYTALSDFDEVLISHGYASFFAVTTPWVCAATMIWAVCEILLDTRTLARGMRRPFPVRRRDANPWTLALEVYGVSAALTNIMLLVFVSDQFDGWDFSHKLVLFVYLVHLVMILKPVIKYIFPEVPTHVEVMHLKQETIAQRLLNNIDHNLHQEELSRLRVREGLVPFYVHEGDPDPEPDDDYEPQFSSSWNKLKQELKECGTSITRGWNNLKQALKECTICSSRFIARIVLIAVVASLLICATIFVVLVVLNHEQFHGQ